ncbi:MAG: hypothetical protein A3E83_07240 [Gammaproteobacteria bacterium RIFCSPHIGHO2_12_FULL_41_20]|nr:MAG: hypothetical protein A3E83_07240 [Gammaproteobacteria bacterium RIFCSPHIGHO2_12_FULL_41_20]
MTNGRSPERQPIRWELWHTSGVPFDGLDEPDLEGSNNILADWNRGAEEITINGESVASIRRRELGAALVTRKGELFDTMQELKTFFKRYLLQYVAEKNRNAALEYLMSALHQGGLLHPVGFAVYKCITDAKYCSPGEGSNPIYRNSSGELYYVQSGKNPLSPFDERVNSRTTYTAFITTSSGFNVQEKVTQNVLYSMDDLEKVIGPDAGHSFVFAAQATLAVRFTGKPKPTVTIENATISYGNKAVKKVLDQRSRPRKWLERKLGRAGKVEIADYTAQPPVHEQFQLVTALGETIGELEKAINAMRALEQRLQDLGLLRDDAAPAAHGSVPRSP